MSFNLGSQPKSSKLNLVNFVSLSISLRPISLTDVDAKIASKVIATRIVKILPQIIHRNRDQTGYISGRYIGEAARSILDVMEFTKTVNTSGILLFIYFEKTFDSLEWNFMFKCLEIFGFCHIRIRWVETFYSNMSSCMINNRLKVNYTKTEAMWIGSCRYKNETPLSLKCCKTR